jgi:type I restriction enzyme M protein
MRTQRKRESTTVAGRKKTTEQPTKQNGSIVDLTKELWEAAVQLRGSIEPADYKRYVLPIIFLRFLSLRFEKRRAELEKLIATPGTEEYGDTSLLEDADEYRKASTFIVPVEARWSRIASEVRGRDDVKVELDRVLKVVEDDYPERLRGLLPPIYGGSNMDPHNLRALIDLFSKDAFKDGHGEDVIGRVYEYFIGEFASSEGKRGGEFFTPGSIVRTLVALLEPERGTVYDPCCGSGGMFVQSDQFTQHSGRLSFYGQESKDFTWRLCKMNLFIHGIDGNIKLGDTYFADQHAALKADYVISNPPFNDGSKGQQGWGADRVADKDPRRKLGNVQAPLAARNANTMWILHFLHHLAEGGTAGFVMATGELSNSELARLEVRKALVENDHVDCIVQLPGQLFANTQIPCALWFLSKGRDGRTGQRRRLGEVLFIDARKLGALIPGSRKQKHLTAEEVDRIAEVYRTFKRKGRPEEVPGFCKVATLAEIAEHRFALTPGRYVGATVEDDEDEPFEERFPALTARLQEQFRDSIRLQAEIRDRLAGVPGE